MLRIIHDAPLLEYFNGLVAEIQETVFYMEKLPTKIIVLIFLHF